MNAGRPRQFSPEEAKNSAMQLFWKQGYEATGLTQLLKEMGLARQSLYNTFGDKKKLYLSCLTEYSGGWMELVRESLQSEAGAADGIKQLLMAYVDVPEDIAGYGCMVVNAGIEFGTFDQSVNGVVTQHMQTLEKLTQDAIEKGQVDGDISPGIEPEAAAKTIVNTMHGIALMNRSGASRESMLLVVQEIMRVLQA